MRRSLTVTCACLLASILAHATASAALPTPPPVTQRAVTIFSTFITLLGGRPAASTPHPAPPRVSRRAPAPRRLGVVYPRTAHVAHTLTLARAVHQQVRKPHVVAVRAFKPRVVAKRPPAAPSPQPLATEFVQQELGMPSPSPAPTRSPELEVTPQPTGPPPG